MPPVWLGPLQTEIESEIAIRLRRFSDLIKFRRVAISPSNLYASSIADDAISP